MTIHGTAGTGRPSRNNYQTIQESEASKKSETVMT